MLDAACGTGVVARYAGPRAGHVVGVDVNAGMLAVAARIAPQLEWVRADVAALPFEDGIVRPSCSASRPCSSCPTAPRRSPSCAGCSRPAGGSSRASGAGRPTRAFAAFADVLDRHPGPGAGAVLRSPFAGGDGEAWRAALTAAGFRDVRVRIELGSASWPSAAELLRQELASSPLAGRRSPTRSATALAADLADALRDHTDDERVVFGMETSVLTGRSPR